MSTQRDLTDDELAEMDEDCRSGCECEMHRMVTEVRRHRAMVLRLEEWATQLDTNRDGFGHVAHFIAAELRNRMKGDGNG